MTEDYSEAKFWVHCLIATVGAVLINLYSVELAILFGWCYGLLVSIKRGSAINITKSWTIGTTTLLFGWLYFSTCISDEMAIYTLCFLAAWICLLGFPYAFMKSLRHKNAEKRRKRVKELLVEKRKQRRDEKNNSSTDEDAKQAKNRRGDRISAKEFRKIYFKFLLNYIGWNIMPVLIILVPLAEGSRPSSLGATPNVDVLMGTVLFGVIALVIIHIILFFRIGLKTLVAQMQRVNDLGWDGCLVVSMTVAFIIVSYYAAYIVRTPSDSDAEKLLAITILLPSVLWGMVLLGLSLFKKGQAIPNKYGLPCNDDN